MTSFGWDLLRAALRRAADRGPGASELLQPDAVWSAAGGAPPDAAVADRVERLCGSLVADARLHPLGAHVTRALLARHLAVGRAEAALPSVEGPLPPVVVLASLPRTGSTVLHRTLASAPEAGSLPFWLQHAPFPPPDARTFAAGGGWRGARARLELLPSPALLPGVADRHPVSVTAAEECGFLLNGTGLSMQAWVSWPAHGYGRWLVDQDPRPAYLFLRRVLLRLQATMRPRWWVLKAPMHLYALPTLLDVFPEARVVLLHRDPRRVVPSTLGLVRAMHGAVSDDLDQAFTDGFVLRTLARMAETAVALRDGPAAGRMLDLDFRAVAADPVSAARRVVDTFGLPAGRMVARDQPATAAAPSDGPPIGAAFAAYVDRFSPTPGA
jgi:hypothetical protein